MIGTFFTFRFVISFWFYFILISLRTNLVLLDFVIPLGRPLLWGNLYSWCWFVFLGCRRISSVFTFIMLVCVFLRGIVSIDIERYKWPMNVNYCYFVVVGFSGGDSGHGCAHVCVCARVCVYIYFSFDFDDMRLFMSRCS